MVSDKTGSVIPGAAVVLTNADTNVTQSTKTNEVGFYFYAGVIPGPYRLSVDFRGLQKFEGTFAAQVSQSVVVDPVLKAGSTTEHVEVVDVTPMVTTDNPTVRNTLEHARVEQLPINGRNVTTLLSTLPGYEGGRVFGSPTDGQEWILAGAVISDRHSIPSRSSRSKPMPFRPNRAARSASFCPPRAAPIRSTARLSKRCAITP